MENYGKDMKFVMDVVDFLTVENIHVPIWDKRIRQQLISLTKNLINGDYDNAVIVDPYTLKFSDRIKDKVWIPITYFNTQYINDIKTTVEYLMLSGRCYIMNDVVWNIGNTYIMSERNTFRPKPSIKIVNGMAFETLRINIPTDDMICDICVRDILFIPPIDKNIFKIGDNWMVGGLVASNSTLEYIGDNFVCNGDIDLRGSNINRLPENLKCNRLDISYTGLTHLPKGLECNQLICTFTPLFELPPDINVNCIHEFMGDVTTIPSGCQVF